MFHWRCIRKTKKKLKLNSIGFENIPPGFVLIKIIYSSICRSQIMEIDGLRDNKKYIPHLLGHEGVGKIVAIGKKVKKFKIGEKVILGWIKNITKNIENKNFFIVKIKKLSIVDMLQHSVIIV